jgi:hypothetical protein
METVHRNGSAVKRILRDRPYHPWRHLPLAIYLCEREYPDMMRNIIIDRIGDGAFLASLVVSGELDPEDLAGASEALEEGRRWHARHSGRAVPRSAAVVPPELVAGDGTEPDWEVDDFDFDAPDPTALPSGDPVYWEDGQPAPCPVQPWTPYEPTEADWEATRTLDVEPFHPGFEPGFIARAREWYRTNNFGEWLTGQGGERP